jgi:hypothetical protein
MNREYHGGAQYICKYCGKVYNGPPNWKGRQYCSQDCRNKDHTQKVICPCGKEFTAIKARGLVKYCSMECYGKYSASLKINSKNPQWVGDLIKPRPLHNWVRRRKLKPEFCEECKSEKPYDLANISGNYKRDINDFRWLCRRCHMLSDGRMQNLKQNHVQPDGNKVLKSHNKIDGGK